MRGEPLFIDQDEGCFSFGIVIVPRFEPFLVMMAHADGVIQRKLSQNDGITLYRGRAAMLPHQVLRSIEPRVC